MGDVCVSAAVDGRTNLILEALWIRSASPLFAVFSANLLD